MEARHIQNHSEAASLIPHWGYVERVFPCTNDAGSCAYLDSVYETHDIGMLYTFIMWGVIGGILFFWVLARFMKPGPAVATVNMADTVDNAFYRGTRSITAAFRRYLLPEGPIPYFGHVTRLQLVILTVLLGYLLVFSFVGGIVYKTWITPVKGTNLYNTRTGLGPFADRIGVLAYALTPLTVALSTRESILTLLTGVSYQHFNFLHRWCGRIIFLQSFVHTLGWTVIEAHLYQPQPKVFKEWIAQEYMVWGVVAMILISFLYIFSLSRVIKWTGHEFFRKTHFLVAVLYLGACWGHWKQLKCWMVASLVVVLLDRLIRIMRVVLIHGGFVGPQNGLGFKSAQATVECYEDDGGIVIRMDFDYAHAPWCPGQHFFLTFPELSVWQSHPFTVASSPNPKSDTQHHTYIIRARNGETSKLAVLAKTLAETGATTPVILMGPYGADVLCEAPNLLAIAGGTGISFVVPLAAEVLRRSWNDFKAIKLVWIVRQARDVEWMKPELQSLQSMAAKGGIGLDIHIYVSREDEEIKTSNEKEAEEMQIRSVGSGSENSSQSSLADTNFTITWLGNTHPALADVVGDALDESAFATGEVQIVASGPSGMGADLRKVAAAHNHPGKVWRGQANRDVSLHWDDRMY